jgi:preprotein translocase subunit SecF
VRTLHTLESRPTGTYFFLLACAVLVAVQLPRVSRLQLIVGVGIIVGALSTIVVQEVGFRRGRRAIRPSTSPDEAA